MSRIAGLVSHEVDRDRAVATMLDRVRSTYARTSASVQWHDRRQNGDVATLGWLGWERPNLAATDGILVAMDGSIYNRDKTDTTDAEYVAQLHRKHGFRDTLNRLNGDFAIALYDEGERTLWLGRDRLGIKPLYYTSTPDSFAFASRPLSLLSLPGVSPTPNRQFVALFAASHYRYFDNDPHASPYADIAQLPAAHFLRYKDDRVTIDSYWSLQERPNWDEPEPQLAQRYRDLLFDAVSIRLDRAPQPAFTLSGGMDSSSVLASAVRVSGRRQHAFSTVYSDKTYDESEEIQSMLAATVEEWHPVAVEMPDIFELAGRVVAIHDEPVATATWLSHFILCQEVARQGFGSLFGGLGGDELNAGEYEYFPYHFADLLASDREAQFVREVEKWAEYHDHPIFRKNMSVAKTAVVALTGADGRCYPDGDRLSRYAPALNPDYFNLGEFDPVMEHPFSSCLKNRTYQDIFRETAPCCLRAEDRQTTAFGLHHFLPFFDYRLVEFMYNVPGTMKIREGVTKVLLREAMKGVLPEETRTRIKKTGWNAPAHIWLSGTGRERLLDWVRSRSFRDRGIYRVEEVCRLIDEHDRAVTSGQLANNHMMFLWQLLNLDIWLSQLE